MVKYFVDLHNLKLVSILKNHLVKTFFISFNWYILYFICKAFLWFVLSARCFWIDFSPDYHESLY